MKKVFISTAILLMLSSGISYAQCSMCRRVAETGYEQQEQLAAERKGRSLNSGILYLLSIPYIIGVVGAFVWYKNRKGINP